MREYFNRDTREIAMGLRAHLAINSNELPKLALMDGNLWRAVHSALTDDPATVELDWVNIGPHLASIIKRASFEAIGKLTEVSVCSFITETKEEDFLEFFGRQESWQTLHHEARVNYYRARFASIYWSSVRDFAVRSKLDCESVFHIPRSMIETVAESTTSQIIDFCHGHPHLQRFSLTCSPEDCLVIANRVEEGLDSPEAKRQLLAFKLIKSNHCASCCFKS